MQNQAQIDQLLRRKSDAREIPGVVAMAANSKEVIYQGAYGKSDLSKDAALKTPIMPDPGRRWEYATNLDFVGKAIEAGSGKRLDAYLRDHMLAPLGMTDTGFRIGEPQRKRLVGMHARGPDGSLTAIPFELEQDPEFHMGGGGLYDTAGDYIKFTQMILNNARGNANHELTSDTAASMHQNQ